MLLYSDIITGDEVFSDSFNPKLVDDVVYEVDCSMMTVKKGVDVDIGANASAEEAEESLEEGAELVNNIVHSFRLQPTQFDKKSYLTHLKGYMKVVKRKMTEKGANEEAVAKFEKDASTYAKKIISGFKDYEFYITESMDPDGIVLLLNFRADGVTPYFTIWKDGLTERKL
ncbi:hypothetical protein ABW20_dc0105478 [Dactylellina cionopaga]|nr:hypothetical protein ABW20_dc0105478 [Dactylellina cionopaga]